VGIIEEIIKRRRPSLIVLANAHTLNIAYEDMSYKQILRNARVIFRDGAGVEWALKIRGIPGLHNFCGTDFIPDFCKFTASKKYRYYLLGSKPDVCRVAAEKLDALAPGIIVSGYHHGYFPHEQTTEIVDRINKSRSDVLLVAMGNPKQEFWIWDNLDRLTVPACIGVGALFDYLSGAVRRAPPWMLRARMEWMFRLITEPRRLWKRYLVGNPKFIIRNHNELRAMRCGGS
jgi:exopolysaccharide biosynthesis WecB/TagA/CpsF family protein